jgi:hypothetical protein
MGTSMSENPRTVQIPRWAGIRSRGAGSALTKGQVPALLVEWLGFNDS